MGDHPYFRADGRLRHQSAGASGVAAGRLVISRDEDRNIAQVLIAVGQAARAVTEAQIVLLEEEVDYWKAHVAALQATQGTRVWSKDDFARGDFVKSGKRWYEARWSLWRPWSHATA